jgi:3-oxoacyl-[acyl-carrier protein] reductase
MELKGAKALITGGSEGIGRGIAAALKNEFADVVITGRRREHLESTAEELGVGWADGDVGREEDAVRTVKSFVEEHGRIDILVNNAGITRDQLLVRMKPEDWDLVLRINLDGAFKVTQPTAKIMMRQKSGRIVNIASVVGLMGNAGQTNYSASKSGLIGFTKSLARELGPRSVTVNAVAPGYIQTAMTDALTDEQRQLLMKSVAIQRLGTPSDVADAVAFLAGPAASYITGEVINVSGGLYM